jgi:hypothetical protein
LPSVQGWVPPDEAERGLSVRRVLEQHALLPEGLRELTAITDEDQVELGPPAHEIDDIHMAQRGDGGEARFISLHCSRELRGASTVRRCSTLEVTWFCAIQSCCVWFATRSMAATKVVIGLAREFVLEPADGPGGGIALHRQSEIARIHLRIGNHDLATP